jgi:predicted hotdog family 3-hydroxylacyl-ACP dehydratase
MEPLYDKAFVESLLPQKAPFVMVDKFLYFAENTIVAGLTVSANAIFIQDGSFTEPGIIEHMAQAVALYTGYQFYLKKEPAPTGYIGSIKEVTVHKLPVVGDELVTEVTVLQEFMGITLVDIVTKCGSVIIAKSQMKTVLAK